MTAARAGLWLLLAPLAACGAEPPPPWADPSAREVEGVPWLAVSAALPRAGPSALPSASSGPPPSRTEGPRCDDGFRTSGEPRHDAARLGLLCGPPARMTRAREDVEGALAEGGAEVATPVALEAGGCLMVVAAAEPTVGRLSAELRSGRGVLLASAEGAGHLVLGAAGTTCSSRREEASLHVRALAGRGRFAAEVWARRREQLAGEADPPSIDGAGPED